MLVSAAKDYDEAHQLIDRLTLDQLTEIRAHMLQLVSLQRRTFVPWPELKSAAVKLPRLDYQRLRADLDAVVDPDQWLGDGR